MYNNRFNTTMVRDLDDSARATEIMELEDARDEINQEIEALLVEYRRLTGRRSATKGAKRIGRSKKDYSFLCMELLLTVLICVYSDTSCIRNQPVRGSSIDELFSLSRRDSTLPFAQFLKEQVDDIGMETSRRFSDEPLCYKLPTRTKLYGAIAFT